MADSRAAAGNFIRSSFPTADPPSPKGNSIHGLDKQVLPAGNDQQIILVCLLGDFQVLRGGRPLVLRGEKAEALIQLLALHGGQVVSRETVLDSLWPDRSTVMAGQCLNSLIYSLRKAAGDAIAEGAFIQYDNGAYQLNKSAGVTVDVALFDSLIQSGHQASAAGDPDKASVCYARAIHLYRGDLRVGTDINAAIERERLRASFLTILAKLADASIAAGECALAITYAQRILEHDPCREDAHRQVMRCFVRLGQRAQAFRQYQLCASALRVEFDIEPEPQTRQLYDQIRLDPASV